VGKTAGLCYNILYGGMIMKPYYEELDDFKKNLKKWANVEYEKERKEKDVINQTWEHIKSIFLDLNRELEEIIPNGTKEVEILVIGSICSLSIFDTKVKYEKKDKKIIVNTSEYIHDKFHRIQYEIIPYEDRGELVESKVKCTSGNDSWKFDEDDSFMNFARLPFSRLFEKRLKEKK